jgi:hypothetical protein
VVQREQETRRHFALKTCCRSILDTLLAYFREAVKSDLIQEIALNVEVKL